jgi:hypothetical protein
VSILSSSATPQAGGPFWDACRQRDPGQAFLWITSVVMFITWELPQWTLSVTAGIRCQADDTKSEEQKEKWQVKETHYPIRVFGVLAHLWIEK